MYTPNMVTYGPDQADYSRLVSSTRSETFLPATPPVLSSPAPSSFLPSTLHLHSSLEHDGLLDHHGYHPIHCDDLSSSPHAYDFAHQSDSHDHLDMDHDDDPLHEQTRRSSSICISPRLLQDAPDYSFGVPYRNPFQASPTISTTFSSPRGSDTHPAEPLHPQGVPVPDTQPLPSPKTLVAQDPAPPQSTYQQSQEELTNATGGLVYSDDGNASAWWTAFEPTFAGGADGEPFQPGEVPGVRYSTRKRVESIKRDKRASKAAVAEQSEDEMFESEAPMDRDDSTSTHVEMIQISSRPRLRKVDKSGELVWPFELETALIAGLRKYHATACRPRPSASRNFNRNKLVSDYIESVTGIRRSTKQIASRIQVLRDAWKGKKQFALVAQPKELSEMGYLPPIDANYYAPPPLPLSLQIPPADDDASFSGPNQGRTGEGQQAKEADSPFPTPLWSPPPSPQVQEEAPTPPSRTPLKKQPPSTRPSPYPRPKSKSIHSRKKKKTGPGDSSYKGRMGPSYLREHSKAIATKKAFVYSTPVPSTEPEQNSDSNESMTKSSTRVDATTSPDVDTDLKEATNDEQSTKLAASSCTPSPSESTPLPKSVPPIPTHSTVNIGSKGSEKDLIVGPTSMAETNFTRQSPSATTLDVDHSMDVDLNQDNIPLAPSKRLGTNSSDAELSHQDNVVPNEDRPTKVEEHSNGTPSLESLEPRQRSQFVSIDPFNPRALAPIVASGDSTALCPSWRGVARMEDIVPPEVAPHVRATMRKNLGVSMTVLATCTLDLSATTSPLPHHTQLPPSENSDRTPPSPTPSDEKTVHISQILDQYAPTILLEIESASIMARIMTLDEGHEKRARLGREIQVLRSTVVYDGKNRVVDRQAGLIERQTERPTEPYDQDTKKNSTPDIYKFQVPLNNKMRDLLVQGQKYGSIVENISILRTSDSRLLESFVVIWVVEAKRHIPQSTSNGLTAPKEVKSEEVSPPVQPAPLRFTIGRLLNATERRPSIDGLGPRMNAAHKPYPASLVYPIQQASPRDAVELPDTRHLMQGPFDNGNFNAIAPRCTHSVALPVTAISYPHLIIPTDSYRVFQGHNPVYVPSLSSTTPPSIVHDHEQPTPSLVSPSEHTGVIHSSPSTIDQSSSGKWSSPQNWGHQSGPSFNAANHGQHQTAHGFTPAQGEVGIDYPANVAPTSFTRFSTAETSTTKHGPVEWPQGYTHTHAAPVPMYPSPLECYDYNAQIGHPAVPSSHGSPVYDNAPHEFEEPNTGRHNSIVPSAHWQVETGSVQPQSTEIEVNYKFPVYSTFSSHMGNVAQEHQHVTRATEMEASPTSSQPVFAAWNAPPGEDACYGSSTIVNLYEPYRRSSAVSTWSTGSVEYPSNTTSCSASSYAPSDKADGYMASDRVSPLPLPPSHLSSQPYYHFIHVHPDYPVDQHVMHTSGKANTWEDVQSHPVQRDWHQASEAEAAIPTMQEKPLPNSPNSSSHHYLEQGPQRSHSQMTDADDGGSPFDHPVYPPPANAFSYYG
ncbi:hypothetical protein CPB86DRAFT_843017 [Serendipita vermifera]|nr:hypothetical protein CPB86DRAFT_843017 [Serendipita vermifera]